QGNVARGPPDRVEVAAVAGGRRRDPPVAGRGPPHRGIRPPVAVEVARQRNVARGPPGRVKVAAVAGGRRRDPPVAGRGPPRGQSRGAISVEISDQWSITARAPFLSDVAALDVPGRRGRDPPRTCGRLPYGEIWPAVAIDIAR